MHSGGLLTPLSNEDSCREGSGPGQTCGAGLANLEAAELGGANEVKQETSAEEEHHLVGDKVVKIGRIKRKKIRKRHTKKKKTTRKAN